MSLELPRSRSLQPSSPADDVRPSHESQQPILRPTAAARSTEPKIHYTQTPESYNMPRLELEPSQQQLQQEGPPPLHPGRSVMRYGPPPQQSEWDYDDRGDRRVYAGRQSYDYGGPNRYRAPTVDEYEDPYYSNRPYRRRPSIRKTTPSRLSSRAGGGAGAGGGPPRPPPKSIPQFDEGSGDESEQEEVQRPRARTRKRSRTMDSSDSLPPEVIMRLPFTNWMNSDLKDHFVAAVGEFVGTTMFLFFAFAGTQVANIGSQDSSASSTTNASTGFSPIVLTYISLSFGFSLMVNVWIFFRISGGLFNPAVTLAMVMVKSLGYARGLLLLGAQIAGSIFTSYIVKVLFPTTFNVRTTLSADTSLARGVFIEAILTAELVFAIFMLAKEKHRATFLAPIGIGIALFIGELVGVFYTGGSMNPARSFGPCVVTGIWDKEHWIYWVGPACGAIGAVGFYNFIKILEYEMANPGQDEASEEKAAAKAREVDEKKEDGRRGDREMV